jgi:hypothetical protein
VITLLRKYAGRPNRYGAPNKSDELAPPHLQPPTRKAGHRIRIALMLEGAGSLRLRWIKSAPTADRLSF